VTGLTSFLYDIIFSLYFIRALASSHKKINYSLG
jgi:hypothetical protein